MIDKAEIERIAGFAKFDLEREPAGFFTDINSIMEMMDKLSQLELTMDVSPLDMELINTFRDDVVKPSLPREAVLANAPVVEAGCISVPKLLGREE